MKFSYSVEMKKVQTQKERRKCERVQGNYLEEDVWSPLFGVYCGNWGKEEQTNKQRGVNENKIK